MRSLTRLMAAAALVCAVSAYGADTVAEVAARETGVEKAGDVSDVLSAVGLETGQEITQEALSRDVRALLDTGRFSYASVEVEALGEGKSRVIYVVRRRLRMSGPLAVKGVDYFSERKVRKLSELEPGDYIDEAVLAERCAKVRDAYRKKHFPEVRVVADTEPTGDAPGFATVTLTVTEGPRRKIKRYVFEGNTAIPDKELRASFGQRPWYDPRGWFVDDPVTAQDLENARRNAEEVYGRHGYLNARISQPEERDLGNEKSEMVFQVEEGDPCTVASTAVRGVTLFPKGEVEESVLKALPVGATAGTGESEKAAKTLRDYYGNRGYADTLAKPTIEDIPGRPGAVAITFDLREGVRTKIRGIVIRGNNVTRDKVIRREILVSPNDDYNERKIELSESRIKNLGYFESVRHYTENPGDDGARDLVYEVQEKRTGSFMIGAGFSSVDNIVGFLEVSQSNFDILNWPNFTGGGQRARAGVEVGDRRQSYEVSWTQPWLFDMPIALTLEGYRRQRWYDEWDETRTGGGVGLSYPVAIGRIGARYRLEQVEMSDVDGREWWTGLGEDGDSTPDTGRDFDNRYFRYQKHEYSGNLNSIARLYWSYDSRNSAFVPTRGIQATVFGEMAEGGIGDNEFWKAGVQYKQWFPLPWWGHVFSLRGRLETVDATNGELPVYERLFLGGPRTVRGVEYRDMGPKLYRGERKTHAAIGGKTMLLVTPEYTIPIVKAVRFAVFSDIGSLSPDEADPEFSDVTVSVGCGLRLDIPGFPIRLDVAKPICEDDSYTDEEVFSFMIGFE